MLLIIVLPIEPSSSESKKIYKFISGYFEDWSKKNMTKYADRFHEKAVIYYYYNGSIKQRDKKKFIQQQQEILYNPSSSILYEKMTSISIKHDRDTAFVTAGWKLVKKDSKKLGIDRFILVKDKNRRWKIISFVFYRTD
ncbi:MAG: nuclear transport factor 2 family protein [Spirochaetota bacterium]